MSPDNGVRVGEPYVPQGAHQRFLIDAWLFLGKNFPSPPLPPRQLSKYICRASTGEEHRDSASGLVWKGLAEGQSARARVKGEGGWVSKSRSRPR